MSNVVMRLWQAHKLRFTWNLPSFVAKPESLARTLHIAEQEGQKGLLVLQSVFLYLSQLMSWINVCLDGQAAGL